MSDGIKSGASQYSVNLERQIQLILQVGLLGQKRLWAMETVAYSQSPNHAALAHKKAHASELFLLACAILLYLPGAIARQARSRLHARLSAIHKRLRGHFQRPAK